MEKTFDFAALDTRKGAEQGHEHELLDLEGRKTGAFITVIGADSDDYQERLNRVQNRRTQEFVRRRKFTASAEQATEDALELLASATRSWRTADKPVILLDGRELTCSFENAVLLYRRLPAVRDQIQEVINDRENFLPRRASSS